MRNEKKERKNNRTVDREKKRGKTENNNVRKDRKDMNNNNRVQQFKSIYDEQFEVQIRHTLV